MNQDEYTREQLSTLPQRVQSCAKAQKKFLKKLKEKDPRDMDLRFREAHDLIFPKYNCCVCANCCTTTGPRLTERDIDNLSKDFQMSPANFEKKYLRVDEDNEWIFKEHPCPFLQENKLCLVYESRPRACREYPHTDSRNMKILLGITYKNIAICPIVFEVVEYLRKSYSF